MVLVDLGANTPKLVTDPSLAEVSATRAVVDVPIDFYIEAPDETGGFVRLYELPDLIRVAELVYVKLGHSERAGPLPLQRATRGTATAPSGNASVARSSRSSSSTEPAPRRRLRSPVPPTWRFVCPGIGRPGW